MDSIRVTGNGPLYGSIQIAGSKNACLAQMPAVLLSEEPLTLTNAPNLSDIQTMTELLRSLGAEVSNMQDGRVLAMSGHDIGNHIAVYDIVRKMRASILVLGPLLARLGRAIVSLPGGCVIGARPVDLHLMALEVLGAELELRDGYVYASAKNGLAGGLVNFPFASVGATENAMMAATLAKGETILKNAARDPEIVDLAICLREMGAKIEGEGTSEIAIEGTDRLYGATHSVMADRIEMGTYMLVPGLCGGEIECIGAQVSVAAAFCEKLSEAGINVEETDKGLKVSRKGSYVKALNVVTETYPGFPTDLQAQMMALMCIANGESVLEEKIFENRFMHASELMRMGARINVQGGTATVTGVEKLKGAPVMATDLRASASLILAGLAATGDTIINRVYHLDRGYERIEEKLQNVGALIERISGQ